MRVHWSTVLCACACSTLVPSAQAFTLGTVRVRLNAPDLFVASVPIEGRLPVGLRVRVAEKPSDGIRALWWAGSTQTIAIVDREGAPRGPVRLSFHWQDGQRTIALPIPGRHAATTGVAKEIAHVQRAPKPDHVTGTLPPSTTVSEATTKEASTDWVLYRVPAGATAWGIAQRMQRSPWGHEKSLTQILDFLVRINRSAFVQGDASRLLAEATIRLPAAAWNAETPRKEAKQAVPVVRAEQTARLARHRLRQLGIGEKGAQPRVRQVSIQAKAKGEVQERLEPAPYLAQGWAFVDTFRVPAESKSVLALAALVNGTTTLHNSQVALAIYRANRDAFIDGNPFRLRPGALLKMPSLKAVQKNSRGMALLWWAREQRKWG